MKKDYDLAAIIYDPLLFLALNPVRKAVAKGLLGYKDKKILDLCCGTGNQLKILAKNGFTDLHCLDLSDSMLNIARKSACKMKIYNEDATETNFDDKSFDLIIISFAIHEKDKITQKNLMNETYRLLKKDGAVLIVDFVFDDQTSFFSKMIIRAVERMAGREHYNNFKNYIHENGLQGIIRDEQFKLKSYNRKLLNGVTISIYNKIA